MGAGIHTLLKFVAIDALDSSFASWLAQPHELQNTSTLKDVKDVYFLHIVLSPYYFWSRLFERSFLHFWFELTCIAIVHERVVAHKCSQRF